jgi:gamma-glutamyltranspeptidase / glutathione hydrolase
MWRCLLVMLLVSTFAYANGPDAVGSKGMVVSVEKNASEIGAQVLREGGTAVDAAVATAFALAVTFPEAGNIGGGGFMLIHFPDGREPVMIDYREIAPAAGYPNLFVDKGTTPVLMVGIPGTVRGLHFAHSKYGKLPWKQLVEPSVKLAKDGFVVNASLARGLNNILKTSAKFPELLRVYGKNNAKDPWNAGDKLVLPELAVTLQLIADHGPDGFYKGITAEKLVATVKEEGGIVTLEDMKGYIAKERLALKGKYRDFEIVAAPPPSSGGTAILTMLNILEPYELRNVGRYEPKTLHLMLEAARRAFLDRARFIGDPGFTKIPEHLITKSHADELRKTINLEKASISTELGKDIYTPDEKDHTTHFSVIDSTGMAISNTYTLEDSYGSRIVVKGAGFILNDELGDFNRKPGTTNTKGLIGTDANLMKPGKRPLSSMTPTITLKNGKPYLIAGSPGGRTIINTVTQVTFNVLEFGMTPREAVNAPRFHHQWLPDRVVPELRYFKEYPVLIENLAKMGHKIEAGTGQGDAHIIQILRTADGVKVIGAADTRRDGWATAE